MLILHYYVLPMLMTLLITLIEVRMGTTDDTIYYDFDGNGGLMTMLIIVWPLLLVVGIMYKSSNIFIALNKRS